MPAHLISVTSEAPRSGKTLVAAAITRWLHREGWRVAPLHLSNAGGLDPITVAGGATLSMPSAVLAEAAGIHGEEAFDGGLSALPDLLSRFDVVVAELPPGAPALANSIAVRVTRDGTAIRLRIEGDGGQPTLTALRDLPTPTALQAPDDDWRALPPWHPTLSPRLGIVSLPHIEDFAAYAPLRGAEWLNRPSPGAFAVVLVPSSSNAAVDGTWLADTELKTWLGVQRALGCKVINVVNSDPPFVPGVEALREDALDYQRLSRIVGARVQPLLPEESELDSLAEALEARIGADTLKRYLAP